MSSILSAVRQGVEENGHTYPGFGEHAYGMPIDEAEQDRNFIQHHKLSIVLDGRLCEAPVTFDPHFKMAGTRVLDIGTGTGHWAIEMADRFPLVEVIATDIAAIQTDFPPPNCFFEIEDAEDDWPYKSQHFDFIHVRELVLAIRDWPKLIGQAFTTLREGGWVEVSATVPKICSDDGTIPPNASIQEASEMFLELGETMGTPCTAPYLWKGQLEEAGLINVEEHIVKIPVSPWAKARTMKKIGAYHQHMLEVGLQSMMIRGWTSMGKQVEALSALTGKVNLELKDRSIHAYCFFYIVYGQKPHLQ